MDGIQRDPEERDDWANTIQTIVDGLDTNEIWEDLTNKEYRITTIEESMNHHSPGGATPRDCTVGEPKGDQAMEDKMAALELAVKELAKAPGQPAQKIGRPFRSSRPFKTSFHSPMTN